MTTRLVSSGARLLLQQSSRQKQQLLSSTRPAAADMSMRGSSWFSTTAADGSARMPLDGTKVVAPPMTYIAGEEMTHYACELVLEQWFAPYFTMDQWEYFDLSCKNRDATNDQVLQDAVASGARIGAIFKEPTITPSAVQVKEFGLSKPLGSPNGAMRRGWNGITISRDTIHIEGIDLGYKSPVYFERHAVGGEYGAGWSEVGKGTLLTTYLPKDGSPPFVVDKRDLTDDHNVVVVYHNPYDNVESLAHLFFQRCLEAGITPYIVTKRTVFKFQEGFWSVLKHVFDEQYKEKFAAKGLLDRCGGDLQHLISDAATMQLIRWTDGGFGMAAHNYDGDMRESLCFGWWLRLIKNLTLLNIFFFLLFTTETVTDQIAQVHRSPGFITSNLVGKSDDGRLIKEFEASHGTVSDLWHDHLAGKETSLNPLGLVEAMIGALQHAAVLDAEKHPTDATRQTAKDQIFNYCTTLRTAMHNTFRYGQVRFISIVVGIFVVTIYYCLLTRLLLFFLGYPRHEWSQWVHDGRLCRQSGLALATLSPDAVR